MSLGGLRGEQGQQVRAFPAEGLEEAENFVRASPPLFCPQGAVSRPSLRADAMLAGTRSRSGRLAGLAMCVQTQTTHGLYVWVGDPVS